MSSRLPEGELRTSSLTNAASGETSSELCPETLIVVVCVRGRSFTKLKRESAERPCKGNIRINMIEDTANNREIPVLVLICLCFSSA